MSREIINIQVRGSLTPITHTSDIFPVLQAGQVSNIDAGRTFQVSELMLFGYL